MTYPTPEGINAFSIGKDDSFPLTEDGSFMPPEGAWGVALPRQVHSARVEWVREACRPADTDAVITDVAGLCVAVKTADCVPILIYNDAACSRTTVGSTIGRPAVAAVHAGWKGTVSRIVQCTLHEMQRGGAIASARECHAIIGPAIAQESFEVGDEVYEAFREAAFPMTRIAVRREKWHIDLWEANRYLLEEMGVRDIYVAGIDTKKSPDWYSARRETIRTGRNYNAIFFLPPLM